VALTGATPPPILPDLSGQRPATPCCLPPGTPALATTAPSGAAAAAIVEAARRHGRALGLLCIGQLTALAEAVTLQPEVLRRVGFLAIQGQLEETPAGGIRPNMAAFNLREDAGAAETVFQELQDHVPFRLLGKHAANCVPLYRSASCSLVPTSSLSREDVEMIPHMVEDIEQCLLKFQQNNEAVFNRCYKEKDVGDGVDFLSSLSHLCTPFDPLLVLSLLHPELFLPEQHGRHTSIGNGPSSPGVPQPGAARALLTAYWRQAVSAGRSHSGSLASSD
jgi:hypothetical protein